MLPHQNKVRTDHRVFDFFNQLFYIFLDCIGHLQQYLEQFLLFYERDDHKHP